MDHASCKCIDTVRRSRKILKEHVQLSVFHLQILSLIACNLFDYMWGKLFFSLINCGIDTIL